MEEQERNFNSGMIFLKPHEQLRKILDQYPNDGQILKELIQNADDAGASEIKFLYDKCSYPTGTLIKDSMAQFQGPALYAYNNSTFEDEDWAGIRMVNRSTKEKNPLKVGRFGLGFKSVYHLTDLPGFMSQTRIAFLDPHERYFEEDMDRTTAKAWDMDNEDFQMYPDQFRPFNIDLFETDDVFEKGYYPKTLFRFPLRQENSNSKISDTVYDEGAMEDLFNSFKVEAHMVLLFLKSLEKIELYQRNEKITKPQLLYRVQMSSTCLKRVNEKRKELLEKLTAKEKSTITYTVDIETIGYENGSETNHETSSWMVTQFYEGTEMPHRLSLVSLKILPLVGIAAPITSSPEGAHGIYVTRDAITVNGHVFCFLPLPLPPDGSSLTGLPFHVNGYFAVDQNRKHLKWATSERTKDQDILWNQHLIKNMLPQALLGIMQEYCRILNRCKEYKKLQRGVADRITSCSISLSHIYSVMKDIGTIDSKWKSVMDLPKEIMNSKMFFSKSLGGVWLKPYDAVFDTLDSENVDNFTKKTIRLFTETSTYHIVHIPSNALQCCKSMFIKDNSKMECLQPLHVAESLGKLENEDRISLEQITAITNYIGSDFVMGLSLLPLANKRRTCYRKRPQYLKDYVFIKLNKMQLLPGMEERFVDPEFQDNKTLLQVAEKGQTQVFHLTKYQLDCLLKHVFPTSWSSPSEVWFPGLKGHPTEKWLKDIWTYLFRNHSSSLKVFENFHLLPDLHCTPKAMLQLSKGKPVVACRDKDSNITQDMAKILRKLNCPMIPDLPKYITQHPAISSYVILQLDSSQFLSILEHLYRRKISWNFFFRALEEEQKNYMRNFIASFPLDPKYHNLVGNLPIFPIWTCTGSCSYVSLGGNSKGSPNLGHLFEGIQFRAHLLDLRDDATARLAKQFSVTAISVMEFIKDYLLEDIRQDFYSSKKVERIMIDIFDHISPSQLENLKEEIRDLKFLPNGNRNLCSPTELYDPRDKLIQILLGDKSKMLSERWLVHTHILKQMGLKTRKDVSPQELLNIALTIEMNSSTKQSEALLKYLLEFPNKLQHNIDVLVSLADCLEGLSWVECLQERTPNYPSALCWKGEEKTLVTPLEVTLRQNAAICGSQMYILKIDEHSQSWDQLFDWNRPPSLDTILEHLQQVISSYKNTEDSKYLHISKEIYTYMSNLGEDCHAVASHIKYFKKWIWCGDGYVEPSAVLIGQFSVNIDMRPYFHVVPNELKMFEHLFIQCGAVVEDNETAVLVLEKMKLECADQPLDKKRLSLAVKLLEELAGFITDGYLGSLTDLENSCGKLYIPNTERVLKEAQTVCYDPIGSTMVAIDSGMDLVHPLVSPLVAKQLGLNTKRQTVANRFIKPFGQTEDLTTRIRGLLKGYPCDAEILKELLQNADDSEATEIHFVLDPREHSKENLISDSWEHLQGPALLVYNNKRFMPEDLEGIQNLGLGSKGDDPSKTGQYGVGFNCVYHLTDVPTFLTNVPGRGKMLCVFDPNCAFVKDADRSKPGAIIDYESKNKFPNVFVPYMEDEFDTDHGTLFRFPFRSEEMLEYSDISKESVDATKIRELFEVFMKEVQGSLLFLNSIQKVTISSVDEQTGKLTHMYRVKATIPQEDKKKVEQMRIATKQASKCTEIKDIEWQCVVYNMDIKEDTKPKKRWKIVKCLGISDKTISPKVDKAFRRGDLGLSPKGGIAVPLDKQMTSGKLYCFLPLPIDTRLPVHVNGHFALDHENRRAIWKSGGHADYRTEWNNILFTDTLAKAYAFLLECIRPLRGDDVSRYYNLFPSKYGMGFENSADYVSHFVRAVYKWIDKDDRKVLAVTRGDRIYWYAPHGNPHPIYFDDLSRQMHSEDVYASAMPKTVSKDAILKETLLDSGLKLLSIPMSIHRYFQNSDVRIPVISGEIVVDFFKNYQSPTSCCTMKGMHLPSRLCDTPFQSTERYVSVLDYCLRSVQFCHHPDGVPLLLTLDEELEEFSPRNKKFALPFPDFLSKVKAAQRSSFVHLDILENLSAMKSDCVKTLGIGDFAYIVGNMLRKKYRQGSKVPMDSPDKACLYIKRLWEVLCFILKDVDILSNESLEPLKKLSILPVFNPRQDTAYLVPICMAPHVVELDIGQDATQPLRSIFRKFGMQELYKKALNHKSIQLLQKKVTTIDSPGHLFQAMGGYIEEGEHLCQSLDSNETDLLIGYIRGNLREIKMIPTSRHTLAQLPLYEDLTGKLISLGRKTPHLVPSNVPHDGLYYLMEAKGYVFVRPNPSLNEIYSFMGCSSTSIPKLYQNVIFPGFNQLSQNEKISHLHFLSTYTSGSETEMLLKMLCKLDFIETDKPGHARVCDLMDPRVEAFVQFEQGDKLLPECWRDIRLHTDEPWTGWYSFLEKLGLQTNPKPPQLLKYAKTLEDYCDRGVYDAERLKGLSAILIQNVSQEIDMYEDSFLRSIRDIKFIAQKIVPTEKRRFHKQANQGLILTCFNGAILQHENENLCWTYISILDSQYLSHRFLHLPIAKRKYISRVLGLKSVEINIVFHHLQNLCLGLEQKLQNPDYLREHKGLTLKRILTNVFTFLSETNIFAKLNDLKKIPMVPVKEGMYLIKASQMALKGKAESEIDPYLFIMPMDLGGFHTLFSQLGAGDEFTFEQYAFVLDSLYKETEGRKLAAKELSMAAKATKGVIMLSKEDKLPNTKVQYLYLLTTNGTLEMSTDMVYKDNESFSNRLGQFDVKMLNCLNCHLEDIQAFLRWLPRHLQVENLSDRVCEQMEENVMAVSNGKVAKRIEDKLDNSNFINGIKRIMYSSLFSRNAEIVEEKLEKVSKAIRSVEVREVKDLRTYLMTKSRTPGFVGDRIPGSEAKKTCFESCESEKWVVFVSSEGSEAEVQIRKIYRTLINLIERLANAILECPCLSSNKLLLVSELFSLESREIKTFLDDEGILEHGSQTKNEGFKQLGLFVPQELHFMLQPYFQDLENDQNVFVAYEIFDELDMSEDTYEENPSVAYKYAQVKREHNSGEAANVQMYVIDIGEKEDIVVPGIKLYRFKKIADSNAEGITIGESICSRNLDEDCSEITEQVKMACTYSENEKKCLIKGLILKWHPDKNIGQEDYAKEVFQHLMNEIKRLEDDKAQLGRRDAMGSNCGQNFSDFVDRVVKRAKNSRRQETRYHETFRRHNTSSTSSSFNIPPSFQSQNPQPAEARRWLRQAKHDLEAAPRDIYLANEWACFKCHQAAEKALKGAQYSIDTWGCVSVTHDLVQLATNIGDDSIQKLSRELQNLVISSTKMRYPDQHPMSAIQIPHDFYTPEMSRETQRITAQLVLECEQFIKTELKCEADDEDTDSSDDSEEDEWVEADDGDY